MILFNGYHFIFIILIFVFQPSTMIQQTIQQVKFQYVMISKLQNQARRTNKLMHWLQYLNALDQNTNYQTKDKVIIQMHQRFILNQDFWIKQINRKFNHAKFNQTSFDFVFLALQDGFYFSAAKVIASKLCSQVKQDRLRLNFVIAKIETLIQHFNHRKKQGAFFYKSLRSIYKLKNNKQKIRETYIRQIKMHFDDFDVVYDQYDMWEQGNGQINKKQYQQLFKNAKALWQADQQYFQSTYYLLVVKIMQVYKTQNQSSDEFVFNNSMRSRVHILRALEQIQDRNTSKLDEHKYVWLLSFLPTQKEKLWFLRRIALMRHQLYQEYLQTLEIVYQQNDQKIINTHKTIISFNLEHNQIIKFQFLYLKFLVRRFNKHLHDKQEEQYNQTWGTKVQFFRNQVSQLLLKARPRADLQIQSMRMFYNFWIDVEAALVKDKEALSHLFQSVITQNPSLDLYIKYSNEMLKFSDIKLAKQILKRACQAFKFNSMIVENLFNFYAIYGQIGQICKFKEQLKTYFQKQKQKAKNSQIAQNIESKRKTNQQMNEQIGQSKVQQNNTQNKKNALCENDRNKLQNDEKSFKRTESSASPCQKLEQKISGLQKKKHHSDNANTLFIKKIPTDWTESDVLQILKYRDHVKQVRLIEKHGQRKDYCYVQYQNDQWSLKEKNQNQTKYQMSLSHPPSAFDQSKTIFVCALPKTATKQAIINLISQKWHQKIIEIRLKLENQKNYGYIDFQDIQTKNKVLEQSKDKKLIIDKKKIIFQQCDSDRIKGKNFVKVVYIKNLPFKCEEQDLKNFFAQNHIENLSKILIPKNQKNRSKGFAYIQFQKFRDYQNALDLRNGQILGRKVQILKSDRQITQQGTKKKQIQGGTNKMKSQEQKKSDQKKNSFFSNMFK